MKFDNFFGKLALNGKKLEFSINKTEAYGGKLFFDGGINLANLSYNIKKIDFKNLEAGAFLDDLIDSFVPGMICFKNKVEGKLDVSIRADGNKIDLPEAFLKLKAEGAVVLSDGKLKSLSSLEKIAEKYNLAFLKQDILVKGLRAELGIDEKVLTVNKLEVRNADVEIDFSGKLDYNNMEYRPGNRLNLSLSPGQSAGLPAEITLFRDERGWVTAEFELEGALKRPLPRIILNKPIEKTVGKLKVKIDAKRLEIENQLEDEKKKAAEDLKKQSSQKIKEILKF